MTNMNDHLMVEDLMPWDHLALDYGRNEPNGSRPPNGWRPPEHNGEARGTNEYRRRLTTREGPQYRR